MDSITTLTDEYIKEDMTSEKPLVSAIITFLNAERFIQEAIESIFSQSYDRWELLLIDDGSTDESSAIARFYSVQFPGRVHYLEHPGHQNRGIPASRNLGIYHAAGEYIAFLDADDVWLPDKLEQQVAILDSHPEAAMLYGLSQWWYSWTGKPEDSLRDFLYPLGITPDCLIEPPQLFFSFFFRQEAAIPCPSDILLRRKALEEVGGFEESFNGLNNAYEDQAFYAKLAFKAPVIAADRCWDRYRQHTSSICSVVEKAGQETEARQFFLNWMASYLSSQGEKDRKLWRELRKEMWRNRLSKIQYLAKMMPSQVAEKILPAPLFHWLRARWRGVEYIPPAGWVRLGSLRRLTPLSREFGYDRGVPVDRYYIDSFLAHQKADIKGHVLEIAEDSYTRQFGGDRVTKSDVLHVTPGDPKATIFGDLTSAAHIPSDTFDCVILTQTLQFIFDVPAALNTLHRILKPGGVTLVTVPGISPVSRYDMDRWGYFWSFTVQSARRLFEVNFPPDCVHVESYGNVLSATAFLYGMAQHELRREELDFRDPDYHLIISIRAVKPEMHH